MRRDEEKPVNTKQAREAFGWSSSYMSAVRRAMGIQSRYFFLSDVCRFIRANPSFTSSQIYHRNGCQCANCREKRFKTENMNANSSVTDATTNAAAPSLPVKALSASELAHRISLLKGTRTSAEVAKGADVSRETFRKIERGVSVKFSTIRKIVKYLKADEQQWREIVVAWIKLEIGSQEAMHIRFSFYEQALSAQGEDSEQILGLAKQLNPADRIQIILAMTRPEVRCSLPALNKLYDTAKRKGAA